MPKESRGFEIKDKNPNHLTRKGILIVKGVITSDGSNRRLEIKIDFDKNNGSQFWEREKEKGGQFVKANFEIQLPLILLGDYLEVAGKYKDKRETEIILNYSNDTGNVIYDKK